MPFGAEQLVRLCWSARRGPVASWFALVRGLQRAFRGGIDRIPGNRPERRVNQARVVATGGLAQRCCHVRGRTTRFLYGIASKGALLRPQRWFYRLRFKGWGSTSGSCAILCISGRRTVVWLQRRFHGVAHDARTAEDADELAVFGDGHFLQLVLGKQAAGIFKRRAGGNGDDAFRGDLAYRELEQRWTREPC
jgi:hypothetical protein